MKIHNLPILLAILLPMTLGACSGGSHSQVLKENHWAYETRLALNKMMNDYGSLSSDYDENNKPYAVFDFDNTTAIFDVEEALLIYQLTNLRFRIARDDFDDVILTDVPLTDFSESYQNNSGEAINISQIATDVGNDYAYLYDHYVAFGVGSDSLEVIHQTKEYQDFIAKVRFAYAAIDDTFGALVSYPWILYMFKGMTSQELISLSSESADYWLNYHTWEKVTLTSPSDFASEAGAVSISYKTSLALSPEMKDLYACLKNSGFEVYVLTASSVDVIKGVACPGKYGLNVSDDHVFGMMQKKDNAGKYLNAMDENYVLTQAEGKTATINKYIASQHDGNAPTFVAGDSDGDYNMMSDYEDMKLGLIINRVKGGNIGSLCQEAANYIGLEEARYVLQGRDENKGEFISSQASILLGSDTPALLHD